MSRKRKSIGQLTTEDCVAFNYFLLNGAVSKESILSNVGISESRLEEYLLRKFISYSDEKYTLTKIGYKRVFEYSLRQFTRSLKKADGTEKKEVNLYITGDVAISENKTGYAIGCLQYKENKKYYSIQAVDCKSPQVIMLQSIYEGLRQLKYSCKVNIHTPIRLGLASCIKANTFKEVKTSAFNYELKTLCQLIVMTGGHDISIFEGVDSFKDEYIILENQLQEQYSQNYKVAV